MTDVEVRDKVEVVEHRDPRGATQRIGYANYGDLPQVQEWDAEQAMRLGYLANVIAYRCVQIRANTAASVPFVAGRKLRDKKTINEKSDLMRLLGPPPGGPAPRLSATKLMRWSHAQKIVTGRRAWEIESAASGRPVAFWPLVASELHATPSRGGNDWFSKFRYGNWSNPVWFKPEDVFYGWEPAGTDFRMAESSLQSARYDLTLVTMCDRYGISFLKNNAVPATIITTTKFPNMQAKQAFERMWSAEFQGPLNVGRTYVHELEDDGEGSVADSIDVKQLGISAKDSRLVDQRKEAMQEIAISLGVHWSKLDASGRTFDNAREEDRTFWEETILPDLIELQEDINMQLAPRLGSDVGWFDLSEVRALRRVLITVDQVPAMVDAGVITINEGRDASGLDMVDDPKFDEFNVKPAPPVLPPMGAVGALDPAAAVDATKGTDPAGVTVPANAPAADGTSKDAKRDEPAVETRVVDPEVVELRRTRIWRSADAVARTLESRWEHAFQRLFSRQADATIARLTGKRGRQATRDAAEQPTAQSIFDSAFWTAETTALVDALYEDVTTAGLQRISLAFGIDFDLAARYVRDFIEARVNNLAGPVTQTTYEAVQGAMADGAAAGEGIPQIAERIRSVFAQASQNRATTIARTEVISSYNGAASLGAAQLPVDVVAGQEWIATRDVRTREAHAAADGQTVAIGQPFDVNGQEMAYPGDPSGSPSNIVNCRCTIAFLTPEEFDAANGRSKRTIDHRVASALLRALPHDNPDADFLSFRLGVETVAEAANVLPFRQKQAAA